MVKDKYSNSSERRVMTLLPCKLLYPPHTSLPSNAHIFY